MASRLPRASMGQLVFLTPSRSSHPTQLLSRQHPAPISPLAATLMDLSVSVANKELTRLLSPLDSALTKNRGGGGVMVNQLSPANNSQSGTRSSQRAPICSESSATGHPHLAVLPLASNRHFVTSFHRCFPQPVDFQPLAGHNFPSAPSPRMAPIIEEGE